MKNKLTILIVDDQKEITDCLKYSIMGFFKEDYFEIIIAHDGNEALEIVENKKGNIALISTDINHPGIKGDIFTKMVKKKYPQIKIILHGAWWNEEMYNNYCKIADFAIQKPSAIHTYIEGIKKLLNLNISILY